jgi:carboxymethylenebutenolidase
MTPQELEAVWTAHTNAEFVTKDVEAVLATMVDEAVNHNMPVNTGARGKDELRVYYRDLFIPSWPDDLQVTLTNRVVGDEQLVDELHLVFSHSKPMDWFLPQVPPTHRRIEQDMVAVVQFRDGKIAAERIYWDHLTVLRQIGLLQD